MGSESSVSEQSQQHHSLNHPKLKIIKYVHNNEIMKAYINVEHSDEFHEWQQRLAQLQNFDEYYLLLPKAYSFGRKAVCGSSGVLQADYDNFPYLLSDQISNRIPHSNYFTQTQLWYLVYGLVSSANLFSKLNSKIGDVQSRNIFLNEQGQIKISNVCSWPAQHTNYQKLIFQHALTYVSPQQLQHSKQGRVDIYKNSSGGSGGSGGGQCDKYLCQSFSIGMTMLQAVLLNSSSDLYDSKRKVIDRDQLNRRVTTLLQSSYTNSSGGGGVYSAALKVAIAGLCQVHGQDRMQSVELYNWLKQYDSQISNLRPCNVDVPPARLRHQYEQAINAAHASTGNRRVGAHTNLGSNKISGKQVVWSNNYHQQDLAIDNVYETSRNSRYEGYRDNNKYSNINTNNNNNNTSNNNNTNNDNNDGSGMQSRSSAQYLLMTPPSSSHNSGGKSAPTSAYNTYTNTYTNTYGNTYTNTYGNTYGKDVGASGTTPVSHPYNYGIDSKTAHHKYSYNSNSNSIGVGQNPNTSIGYISTYTTTALGAATTQPYSNTNANTNTNININTNSIGNVASYGTSLNTISYNKAPLSNTTTNTALTNTTGFGAINTNITSTSAPTTNTNAFNTKLAQDHKYNTYNTYNTYKDINKDIGIPTNTYALGSTYNTAQFGYPSSYNRDREREKTGSGMNISTKAGTGNAYLQDIYSMEVKTPTFPTSTPFTAFNNYPKDITFDAHNINNLYVGTIDNLMARQPSTTTKHIDNKLSYNTTFGNLNTDKASNLGNTSNQYSFSNISSIPREDPLSSHNPEPVNVFTPTHTYTPNLGDTKSKYDDSSTDLLKKINEEIMRTKQKYSIDDHSP